ncbi:MAG TPA: ribose 5-phosphate isomerase A [Gemmatimonadaceae bacterium]
MTDTREAGKRDAALEAVARLRPGLVVGLGTGSTAVHAIEEIGRRLARGELRDIVGIPTSEISRHLALEQGIPVGTLDAHPVVDITIDGADEIDPEQRVLKGRGGALLREKIVASRSRRWVLIVDRTKLTPRLGSRHPLPVEVVRFGWRGHLDALRELGAQPALRLREDGSPFVSDEGHYIIDARFPDGIHHPASVADALRHRPGVVETGLFLGFAPEVIVGGLD